MNTLRVESVCVAAGGWVLASWLPIPADPVPGDPTGISALVLLTFLLPVGLMLLVMAAWPPEAAARTAVGGSVAWALAVVAYFVVGFAFQFGGVAVVSSDPGLAGLSLEYSLLDPSWGSGWGMVGFAGFLLNGGAATPRALELFLAQLPFLGIAVLLPYFTAAGRLQGWVVAALSLAMGGIIYPLVGNWVWGGGWLAQLGNTVALGHGLVDAGGAAVAGLSGVGVAVAVWRVERSAAPKTHAVERYEPTGAGIADTSLIQSTALPMPALYLPLMAWLGAVLMLLGAAATASSSHIPLLTAISSPVAVTNVVLGAFGGTLAASLYGWFVLGETDLHLSARGMAAGTVCMLAGAPFLPAWIALLAGVAVGILAPVVSYLTAGNGSWADQGGILATWAVPAVAGLLLVGIAAQGQYGHGWNNVWAGGYQADVGVGITGSLSQLSAQAVSILVVAAWSFSVGWGMSKLLMSAADTWERSGLEFGALPGKTFSGEAGELPLESSGRLIAGDEKTRHSEDINVNDQFDS